MVYINKTINNNNIHREWITQPNQNAEIVRLDIFF